MTGFQRYQALIASNSVWTRNLRHVDAVIPRFWSKRMTFNDPSVKDVKPKDRIKWWNIVPGDQVRVRGDPEGTLREVQVVHKLRNMVYLKRVKEIEGGSVQALSRGEGVHYSECQLFIGRHQFPPAPGSSEPRILPVFATRVEMTNPKWLNRKGHYLWTRFAASTTPRLPGFDRKSDDRVIIPWPKLSPRPAVEPSPYETTLDAVKQITYVKPALPANTKIPLSKPISEHTFVNRVITGGKLNPAAPVEVYVHRELTNPHSRAKKQARWQAQQRHRRLLLEQMMAAEVKNLKGRTKRVARMEAVWKWKNWLVEERKAELERRRVNRGEVARQETRKVMRARKAARIDRQLQNMVLDDAPNQVVPDQPSA